jgi:hypothetical protein
LNPVICILEDFFSDLKATAHYLGRNLEKKEKGRDPGRNPDSAGFGPISHTRAREALFQTARARPAGLLAMHELRLHAAIKWRSDGRQLVPLRCYETAALQ